MEDDLQGFEGLRAIHEMETLNEYKDLDELKKVAIYDVSGFFSGLVDVQKCIITKQWLMPPNTTELIPDLESLQENEAFSFDGENWSVVPDYSAAEIYDKLTGLIVSVDIGVNLSDNMTLIKPPGCAHDEIVTWKNDAWIIEKNLAGQSFYNKQTKELVVLSKNSDFNDSLTQSVPLKFDCIFDESSGAWVLTDLGISQKLQSEKTEALKRLNEYCQSFVDKQSNSYDVPEFEVKSWSVQAAEAEAWALNNSADTPLLDSIARARGIDRIILINKALEKARAYTQLVGLVSGRRQKFEDEINQATSIDALISFSKPDELFADLFV